MELVPLLEALVLTDYAVAVVAVIAESAGQEQVVVGILVQTKTEHQR
jgi:hypothetical protein